MGDREVDLLAVRTIEVTTRHALEQISGEAERAQVRVRAAEMLARLEERILSRGGDLVLLEALEDARRGLWD